ncbi:MAG TPA: DUF3365 domain-containing protein [Thiobacillaceae bacterium]|nr:DUF3365 domain-containing protein [Thiobacillaceae bacterium]HNU63411.1 DUF3365 domain-containing protein [Thiobacillaceae bacterium]
MQGTLKISFIALFLAGCSTLPSTDRQAQMADEARATAMGLMQTLGGELKNHMAADGPANAIGVCKDLAPAIAKDASQRTGMMIKRVSTKNRNPKGVPDAWEAAAISDFEKRLAAGEKVERLETYTVVEDGGKQTFRYAKALVTQAMCLECHGAPENMRDDVKAKLVQEYPNDKAVGYSAGQVRGIITMRKPL